MKQEYEKPAPPMALGKASESAPAAAKPFEPVEKKKRVKAVECSRNLVPPLINEKRRPGDGFNGRRRTAV